MAAKVKIAISLSEEVLALVDRHADGRSRSRCIEEELQRALRAREWERLASAADDDEIEEDVMWASESFAYTAAALDHTERAEDRPRRPARSEQSASKRSAAGKPRRKKVRKGTK